MTSTALISEKERLYHFYVILDMTKKETCEAMGYYCIRSNRADKISIRMLNEKLKFYEIKRPICLSNFNTKRTSYKIYGTDNPNTLKEIREKIKQTNLKRYGAEHVLKTKAGMDKLRKTNLERYGNSYVGQVKEFKDKIKETNLEKYGVENVYASEYAKEKSKQTCLEKYGVEYYVQTDEYKQKLKEFNLKKYGVEYYTQTDEYKKKNRNTCLKKYGVECTGKSKEIQNKIEQTNLEKYGVKNAFQVEKYKEKAKQTCKEKFDTEYYTQTEEYKERSKNTCLEKYGVEYVLQSEEIKQKSKQTCLNKYGVENVMMLPKTVIKAFNTKKLKGNVTTSIQEDQVKAFLLQKFPNLKCQYRSDKYPFHCDFYIPELDLYIEYQGHWSHGKKLGPFNENDPEHVKVLCEWKEKAKNSQSFVDAINVWTVRDPLKRKIAKENNLSWLEFFTVKDFITWYEKL